MNFDMNPSTDRAWVLVCRKRGVEDTVSEQIASSLAHRRMKVLFVYREADRSQAEQSIERIRIHGYVVGMEYDMSHPFGRAEWWDNLLGLGIELTGVVLQEGTTLEQDVRMEEYTLITLVEYMTHAAKRGARIVIISEHPEQQVTLLGMAKRLENKFIFILCQGGVHLKLEDAGEIVVQAFCTSALGMTLLLPLEHMVPAPAH